MSSYLERQTAAFRSDAMSAAPKVATKQRLAAPVPQSAPSPAPSNSSVTSKAENKDAKRKREAQNVVFSQPATTGYGTDLGTNITYAIAFLKAKSEPKTFREILEYLSQVHADDRRKQSMANILKKHDRVHYIPDPKLKVQTWDSGLYEHKPLLPVRSKADLIAYLQRLGSAQGVPVKDLKDGWENCGEAIDEMELEHKLLVTRTKKDNLARMVWLDDPTLRHSVDPEFHDMWKKVGIELPSVDEVVRKLQEAGQKPASEDPSKRIKAAPKPKEKKKRAARRGGKTTNTHMLHLLRDSNDLKRK
jgi:transcription initiation factor TFIIE subunit beta